jgi:hypothetical protein
MMHFSSSQLCRSELPREQRRIALAAKRFNGKLIPGSSTSIAEGAAEDCIG